MLREFDRNMKVDHIDIIFNCDCSEVKQMKISLGISFEAWRLGAGVLLPVVPRGVGNWLSMLS